MKRKGLRKAIVSNNDDRSPMLRLMQDGRCRGAASADGRDHVGVNVNYAEQWPTLLKAMRLGYVLETFSLTQAGVDYLVAHGVTDAVLTMPAILTRTH